MIRWRSEDGTWTFVVHRTTPFPGDLVLLAWILPAFAGPDLDHAWYLWHTNRPAEALAMAEARLAEEPADLPWMRLALVAGVDVGDGPRLEHSYRDALALEPTEPVWRAALATVLALRNTQSGRWCGEIDDLLAEVKPSEHPEPAYLGLQAKVLALRACEGNAEKLGIDLRRAAELTPLAAADAAIDRLDAGYAKVELPDALAAALDAHPLRLRDVEGAWNPRLTGPALPGVKATVRKRIVAASESDRPAEVWAAIDAWADAGNPKRSDAARARLATLDPGADPDGDRELEAVADPPVYAAIRDAVALGGDAALAALDAIAPDHPAAKAAVHAARGKLLTGTAATEAHHAAWAATPDDRLLALRFAKSAAATGARAAEAVAAMGVVTEGRVIDPLAAEAPDPRIARRYPAHLDLTAQLHALAGDHDAAVTARQELLWFEATPAAHARLGLALHAAGAEPEAAVLHLATGLGGSPEDAALATEARAALTNRFVPERHDRGLGGLLVEAARDAGSDFPDPTWVGGPFPLPEVAGAAAEDAEGVPELRMVTWVAGWDAATADHLAHLADVAASHGDRVQVAAFAVDAAEDQWSRWLGDRELAVPVTWTGPAPLAALRTVRVPYTALIAPDGTALAVVPTHGGEDDTRLDDAAAAALDTEEE